MRRPVASTIGDAALGFKRIRAPPPRHSQTGTAAGRRAGFGPKTKPKSNGYGPLYALGLIAIGGCGYAIFTFMNLSA